MEKMIRVGEHEFLAKSTAASLISYKANFGRDGLRDLIALTKGMKDGELTSELDVDVFFRFLWVFAKASNKEIPPLDIWLESFETPVLDFITQAFPQVMELLSSTVGGSVSPKKGVAAAAWM